MEGYGNYVEILGSRFPACNIQIWSCHPELHKWTISGDTYFFGVYFELMFETGTNVIVTQEAAGEANGLCSTNCKDDPNFLNHYLVEEYRNLQTQEPSYAWHCVGEEELLKRLNNIKRNESWIDGAPKMVLR